MRTITFVIGITLAAHSAFAASTYTVHNYVADIADLNAVVTDPNLIDPWGIALSAGGPFWISNAGSGTATVYSYSNVNNPPTFTVSTLVVKVPSASGGPARVTGQIVGVGAFALAPGQNPSFIFCTEDGTISGWNRSTDPGNAVIKVNNADTAVYKGCTAAANTSQGPLLFAANFKGGIDVFDTNWSPVGTPGGFVDPNIPDGFGPFNVWLLGQKVYVLYAKRGLDGVRDAPGAGNGFVDVYDTDGNLLQNLIAGDSHLSSPWGIAIAPEFFGDFSFAVLIGNFGDGTINAYDPLTGSYLGTLSDKSGQTIVLEGLWALQFGNNKSGGDAKTLYVTAGVGGGARKESHGLLAGITTP